ncbi:hypothetical protein BHE74_00050375 [Ensete ventricosum]|nr:hypothetical protein BHE74_00050375 [Ensete ventricosum]RZS27617.1 hypothetical protein BHM03_00061125 [Ensete ventricosum]
MPIPCEVHQSGLQEGGLRWGVLPLLPCSTSKEPKRDLCFFFLPTLLAPSGDASEVQSKRAYGFFILKKKCVLCHAFTTSGSKSPLPLSSFHTYFSLPFDSSFYRWYWQEAEPLRGRDEKGSILKMGACTSVQKDPDSPMRCRLGLVSRAKRIFVSSPAKGRALNRGSPFDRFGFQSPGFGMVSYRDQVILSAFISF